MDIPFLRIDHHRAQGVGVQATADEVQSGGFPHHDRLRLRGRRTSRLDRPGRSGDEGREAGGP